MLLDREGLGATLRAAIDASVDGAGDEARGALHGWLVLAASGLAACARGVAGAPTLERVERAAREGGKSVLAPLAEALASLHVAAAPPDGALAARAVVATMAAVAAGGGLRSFADLDEASLGEAREAGMARAVRRARGAHSTPHGLADAVACDGLSALEAIGGDLGAARVLDPAAGGGALLLATGRALLARAPPPEHATRRGAIADRLFGVERDPEVATLARAAIALWGATEGCPATARDGQVLTGDVLASLDPADLSPWATAGGAEGSRLARELADALVDAFFAVPAAKRAREQARRTQVAEAARRGHGDAVAQLAAWAAAGRARGAVHPALAWAAFDLAVLNPPFLGGKRIATVHGEPYAAWLAARHPLASGNADLAAHVLLAASRWLAPRAVVSIVATNTLVEGATRHAALERMMGEGHVIASAWRSARWPGTASVNVVRLALARGGPGTLRPRLDGDPVAAIDAGLRAATRRPPPRALAENEGTAFVGFFLRGDGFVVERDEAEGLLARDPRNAACLRPYLVGQDVLRDPERHPRRWVIDFGTRSLEEAQEMPDLLEVVERRVRPVREALAPSATNRAHRRAWWRFANARPELRRALVGRDRCIVAPRVAKHLAFAWASSDVVFSEQLVVVASDAPGRLGALVSWAHDAWARAHSSSLQSGLRYLPSRAFATFPFPRPNGGACAIDAAALTLVAARDAAARALGVGLTTLRDRLDAGADDTPGIARLRDAQRALDVAVLDAFGWSDLTPPTRGACTAREREAFEAAVVERLADENQRRAPRGDGEASLV